MKAVVKFDNVPDAVELREVPEPEQAGDGRVLLRVRATSVCGSDVHQWRNKQSWKVNVPVIMGHEFCGVVESVGTGVSSFATGERVACETAAVICGTCVYCRTGRYNLCPQRLGYAFYFTSCLGFVSPFDGRSRQTSSPGTAPCNFPSHAPLAPACLRPPGTRRGGRLPDRGRSGSRRS